MGYSFTEKKRLRKSFSKRPSVLRVPYLLATQKDSYKRFLQTELKHEDRREQGLQAAFHSVFPIESYNGNAALEFLITDDAATASDAQEFVKINAASITTMSDATNTGGSFRDAIEGRSE